MSSVALSGRAWRWRITTGGIKGMVNVSCVVHWVRLQRAKTVHVDRTDQYCMNYRRGTRGLFSGRGTTLTDCDSITLDSFMRKGLLKPANLEAHGLLATVVARSLSFAHCF